MTQAIFTLPFIGKNFFRGIVVNHDRSFDKDAAYELLKGTTYNWRRLLLHLGQRLHSFFRRLTDEDRETVLIIVELLSRVYDHSTGRYLKGFRMLTVCWSDGESCLPLDFSLLSSADAKKRLYESQKVMDNRCCAQKRRKEAIVKATGHLEIMVKRILSAGIRGERTASAFVDAIIDNALQCVGLSKNNLIMKPES